MMTPQHKHDCERCTFVGRINNLDLYYCKKDNGYVEYLARFSDEGSAYYSGFLANPDIYDGHMEVKTVMACAFSIGLSLKDDRK